jgi:hypothetical protein
MSEANHTRTPRRDDPDPGYPVGALT